MLSQSSTVIYHPKHRAWWPKHECVICGSKAIGVNFGAPTCAPCKAFFRRNARRKDLLQTTCPFQESTTINMNGDEQNGTDQFCSQVRYCSSCRLRRCFAMGMKEELVRTDEENQRYRQLVETNRRRRKQLIHEDRSETQSIISKQIISKSDLLNEIDWMHVSNIVSMYDSQCLKHYIQERMNTLNILSNVTDEAQFNIDYHATTTVNKMTSFILFISTIPTVKSLPKDDRIYLCKHNIRPLILLNSHELDQQCYSEPWQLIYDNRAAEYICGSNLFPELLGTRKRAEQILITDPVVTRLWLLILFFSSPLHCYVDYSLPDISASRRRVIIQIQNSYTTLLWNYLTHRHGDMEAIRIFSNLNGIYLRMQRISEAVNRQIRTRDDLSTLNDAFNRAVMIESDIKP
ncbi:hypothetical protein I4U23_024718 [Adineta vaga]|nr:hypothetical protein I4U23_024718 [Adineta vaga]